MLITIGIIGVVAAMTMPTVINRIKTKQLEVAFKRTSSLIENALNDTAWHFMEAPFEEFNRLCGDVPKVQSAACRSAYSGYFKEVNDYFISRFAVVQYIKSTELGSNNKINAKDYSGKYQFSYNNLYGISSYNSPKSGAYILNDGSLISNITFFYHEPSDGISLTFDTNGPNRGPNRYGYDIFLYNTGRWSQFCTVGRSDLYNGRACYKYAKKDINPDDSSKKYWASLYK